MTPMKILVTGGAGFIASHIVDAYVKAGHRVSIVDNLTTGSRRNLNPRARFYKADITNPKALENIFKKERPEIVNHHAALISVVRSVQEPLVAYTDNILGTANVAIAFGKYGKGPRKKFIFASTGGAIYGNPSRIPVPETTEALPLAPYGLSKLLAEEMVRFYARYYGFPYLIFRYSNIYGPRQNSKGEAGVVAVFGGLMKAGKRPTIFGDGTKARDYVYVTDVAQANLLALSKGKSVTLNLGCGKTVSDRAIYDNVARAARFKQKPKFAPYRKGEVYKISLDARRARRLLGWTPRVNIEEGTRRAFLSL